MAQFHVTLSLNSLLPSNLSYNLPSPKHPFDFFAFTQPFSTLYLLPIFLNLVSLKILFYSCPAQITVTNIFEALLTIYHGIIHLYHS